MLVRYFAKMLCILVLCPVLLVAVQTLTIDSQLGTSVEDCFERITIGEQLPPDAIYRNVTELTTRECETICKQDKQCQSYDYGVGAKGNATCNLSTVSEKELKEKSILRRHPDYDVYIRRFQCEQSPPTPLQPQFDEGEGPAHKPVFRPNEDEPKRPLDDYPSDLRPFETVRPDILKPIPPYRPGHNYIDERPDGYNQKPALDNPPSYGEHRPPDIPYRPSRPDSPSYGLHKPADVYRPHNQSTYKPDPYDVLHFQEPYRPHRPLDPGYWRPDPYHPPHLTDDVPDLYGPKPIRPSRPNDIDPYGLEKPQYHYIVRPNRKPRPEDDGYSKPGYPGKPDPYQDVGHPSGPLGSHYNYRPNDKPSYSYNSQYASNYGQSQYQDNSIYLEIYDPPRPYKPPRRPIHDRPGYGPAQDYRPGQNYGSSYGYGPNGYGSHLGHGSYSQSSHSSYGQGTITEIGFDSNGPDPGYYKPERPGHRPQDSVVKPQKPDYVPSSGYGSSSDVSSGYGPQKPSDVTQRPSYGSNQGSYTSQASYGSSSHSDSSFASQSYGGNRPSYGSNQENNQSGYGVQKPIKPSDTTQRPSYGGSLEDHQPSHGGYGQASYGGFVEHHNSHYSSQQSSQSIGSYGSRPPFSDRPSYTDDRPGYGGSQLFSDNQSGYGGNRPSFGDDRPGYRPSYERPYEKPSYGERPSYDRPSYGDSKPSNDNRPLYGDSKPSLDRPSYGDSKPSYDGPSYGDSKPSYTRPPYSDTKPSYDRPSYGDSKPSHDRPAYSDKPSFEGHQPSYGDNRPSFDSNRPDPPSYSTQSGYGSSDANTGYGAEDYKNNVKPQKPAYGSTSDTRPNQTATDRPGIKPVYEYELEKPLNVPSYIVRPGGDVVTSRPVTIGDYGGKPGQGRGPGYHLPYTACFRRVLAGRRALRSFVRKAVPCERLEDCRRECAEERRFHCESFNYRLDPTFRGKGLCELMTRPIEAFDISRDFVEDKQYDFYELDRNSLEPHCPDSLPGPGVLHSGFLSSKPDRLPNYHNQWRDRTDDRWQDTRYSHNRWDERFYEDRRHGGRRRYEDQFYVPYQIGIARSNDGQADIENWGVYGGSYGGYDTYYKDRADYFKSINHWRIPNEIDRSYGVKPGQNRDFDYYSLGKDKGWEQAISGHRYGSWKRGRWNSSGSWSGLDYGESKYYNKKPHYYEPAEREDDGNVKDCSSRRRPGMSLGSGAIRRALLARNVVECEAACFGEREFKCVSYSYRYSSSRGTDNCFLSERPYRGLELSADSGSDVYAMPQDHGCSTISHKPWIESECFWHVRSEAAVSGSAVRAALTVAGLGACEAECIRAHAFFCRGFSFRFEAPTIGDDLENCILTSSPPTSLEAGRGLRPTSGHELYARGNYGRGCEPALYDDSHPKETQCYLQYDNAAKLIGTAVRGQARVRDEEACGSACTEAPFRCLSFSFNNNAPPGEDNCLLSDVRLFDLQRGVDYQHSSNDWLFAFDLFNGQCWRKVHGKTGYDEPPSHELPRPIHVPEEIYPGGAPSGSGYPSGPPSGPPSEPYLPISGPPGPVFKPGYPSGPGYHEPSGPEPSFKPHYPPSEPSAPGYLPKPEYKPSFRPESSGPEYLPKPDYRPAEPSGPGYLPKPDYRPSQPSGSGYLPKPDYGPSEPSGPGYLPKPDYRPSEPSGPPYAPGFKPGFRPSPSYPDSGFKPGYPPPQPEPGYRPGGRPYPERPKPGYGDREDQEPRRADRVPNVTVSWRHYTVSGFPCRAGTTCAQNQIAGHWACEPEGGEVGSWDYCCAPNHRCGYSEGFVTPWCYVGTNQDQWRPCSEKYYPYHQHNIPHPSQGHVREDNRRPPRPQRPDDRPPPRPYTSEADRRYWDELYKNGPRAYYDKYGNPLPGYTRVPTASRPYIKYRHNYPGPGSGSWVPVAGDQDPHTGGLGAPRYWPVAYLHKGPPPNMTFFTYNETKPTTTEAYQPPIAPPRAQPPPEFNLKPEKPKEKDVAEARNHRDEKTRNITDEDLFKPKKVTTTTTTTTTTTPKIEIAVDVVEEPKEVAPNKSDVETLMPENLKDSDEKSENLKGIDDKLEDFTSPIEVLDIEDAKSTGEKMSDLKTLEAEERQIEAIGRLLASRRGSKIVLEKRSQKDLESKNIAVDKDLVDFNFGNRFPTTERRGIIQKVTKDEIERERNADKSLEVSETTFVRPPRVLSTTENIRKAIINGKVFYDATIREQRDIFSNATRKAKNFRQLEDSRAPSVIANSNFGKKKIIKTRNVNPVRRVRRVYRKRYNPEEVRRRLLERERSMKSDNDTTRKV